MTDPDSNYRYKVFLSYSHLDRRWARWLHRALETYRPPVALAGQVPTTNGRPDRVAPVFRDREELPSAASLTETVNQALERSESLVVICSPNAAQSRWVNEEILYFKRLGRADRIFCLIVDGEPNSGDTSECFPDGVRFEWTEADGLSGKPVEPLAADARKTGDGKTLAKLKLVAGILGVEFDALRQRDLQRRYHRLLAITAGALLMAVLTISLAVKAYLSSAEAERRREQAEDLIGFMLGDLQDGLYEIGRLDIFIRVGNKALDYFSSMADEDVDNRTLDQRATALLQIGNTMTGQGEMQAALESFTEANAIARKLVENEPDNPEWQLTLANSHYYIGYVHWERSELEQAREQFETVISIVDDVSRRDSGNPDWLTERSYAYTNLARVLEQQGHWQQALSAYREVAAINSRALELDPGNVDFQLEIGFSHNNIGKVDHLLGKLEDAELHFREDLAIKERIAAENPDNNLYRDYLAVSQVFLGRIFAARGKLQEARDQYLQAVDILGHLREVDPAQVYWSRRMAAWQREFAVVDLRLGDVDSARARIGESNDILKGFLDANADDQGSQRGIALNRLELASLSVSEGEPFRAIELADQAWQSLVDLQAKGQPSLANSQELVLAGFVRGEAYRTAGEEQAARRAWEIAAERVRTDFPLQRSPELTELYAVLMLRLGNEKEAREGLRQLQEMGFEMRFEP